MAMEVNGRPEMSSLGSKGTSANQSRQRNINNYGLLSCLMKCPGTFSNDAQHLRGETFNKIRFDVINTTNPFQKRHGIPNPFKTQRTKDRSSKT